MRKNLLHVGHKELSYEIRNIVNVGKKIESFGKKIFWENIGDPIAKGEKIPFWIKDIVQKALQDDKVFGYSPSRGSEKALEYVLSENNKIDKENVIFFNGLGEAINKIYKNLSFDSRVIGPNPAYSTHSSAEAAHAGSPHITYSLDPYNGWKPDLVELENKVKYNPNIVAILVINPDNPTGYVFSREDLEAIVNIAKKYDLFLLFDEIYEKLIFDQKDRTLLKDVIGDVPGISMKGISKDVPWPGARCGWIEVYNQEKDENFCAYIQSILSSKMLEVCSTTLPQFVLSDIYTHKEFYPFLQSRIQKYHQRAEIANDIFSSLKGVLYIKPKATFYFSIIFHMPDFKQDFEPNIEDANIREYIHKKLKKNDRFDKKFCYFLLASSGICCVPMSSFNSSFDGFRCTLLEEDKETFIDTLEQIRNFILLYLDSKS